jgi:hypothetical protein
MDLADTGAAQAVGGQIYSRGGTIVLVGMASRATAIIGRGVDDPRVDVVISFMKTL